MFGSDDPVQQHAEGRKEYQENEPCYFIDGNYEVASHQVDDRKKPQQKKEKECACDQKAENGCSREKIGNTGRLSMPGKHLQQYGRDELIDHSCISSEFKVRSSGSRGQGPGFRVRNNSPKLEHQPPLTRLNRFRVQSSKFRVKNSSQNPVHQPPSPSALSLRGRGNNNGRT